MPNAIWAPGVLGTRGGQKDCHSSATKPTLQPRVTGPLRNLKFIFSCGNETCDVTSRPKMHVLRTMLVRHRESVVTLGLKLDRGAFFLVSSLTYGNYSSNLFKESDAIHTKMKTPPGKKILATF